MPDTKKIHWLKLKTDFFNQREVKKLRRVAGGDTYTIIYLKLQLLSAKNDGIINFEGTEKSLAEQLELELDEELENIKITLSFLQANGLIESINDSDFLMPKVCDCIGKEGSSAARVRKHRDSKMLQCNNTVTICNTEKEKEKEKEKERREEIDKEKEEKRETKKENFEEQNEVVELSVENQDFQLSQNDAKEIAKYLFEKIKSFNPTFKNNYSTWEKDIEKALRIDKRTKAQLIDCIDWIYSSDKGAFWIPNILSGKKLREKFDTMNIQAMSDKSRSNITFIKELCKDEQ
jgi:predicted phage replisome organizer